jgi:type I restriction enzyme M protein
MRRKLLESDVLECVLGLGPGLFYNSPMEACVVVCRTRKVEEQRRKVLFINAVNEYSREQAQSFLREPHIEKILDAYRSFNDIPAFARVVTLEEIEANDANLSIPVYVSPNGSGGDGGSEEISLEDATAQWEAGSRETREAVQRVIGLLREEVGG